MDWLPEGWNLCPPIRLEGSLAVGRMPGLGVAVGVHVLGPTLLQRLGGSSVQVRLVLSSYQGYPSDATPPPIPGFERMQWLFWVQATARSSLLGSDYLQVKWEDVQAMVEEVPLHRMVSALAVWREVPLDHLLARKALRYEP